MLGDTAGPDDLAELTWRVVAGDSMAADREVRLLVCTDLSAVQDGRRRWPHAAILAIVAEHDDGRGTLAALAAGAAVCVRGTDPALLAAYLRAMARRLVRRRDTGEKTCRS